MSKDRTQPQAIAVNALTAGAYLDPTEIIAGLDTQDAGEDLIVMRRVLSPAARPRTQRWRLKPDGSPRLEIDGARLN